MTIWPVHHDIGDYWRKDYVISGEEEIKRALCIKNTIPNVSAVLFRRNVLKDEVLGRSSELFEFSSCWRLGEFMQI